METLSPASQAPGRLLLWARITLVLVYAVILAGSIVRATGSGMGCPDWPKCFGHYIPPTDISQLQYEKGREFKAGHFIIWQEALWKAKRDLVATEEVDPDDWEKYTKHDYAVFNPAHTWTEYVNRLMGALLGIASFITFIVSIRHKKIDRVPMLLSLAAMLLIGFEAWLGAKVVESNLAPVKITTHMVVAFIILALVTWLIHRIRSRGEIARPAISFTVKALLTVGLLFSLAQTILGTQVREQVDTIATVMADQQRETWIDRLGTEFEIHRTFALVVMAVNTILVLRLYKEARGWPDVKKKGTILLLLLLAELGTGVILARAGLPAAAQPTHLMLAALIFGVQFSLMLDVLRTPRANGGTYPAG